MLRDLEQRSAFWRYGLAVLAVAIAVLLTFASEWFGLSSRSAAFLAAILLTGWYAGTGPLVVAMVLSTLAFDYFFLPPLYTIGLEPRPDPYMVWFLLFAVLAAWFSAARRRGALQLEHARRELERKVAERTAELQRSETYLAAGQRLSHTGSFARQVKSGEIYWSEETYRIFGLDSRTTKPHRTLLTHGDRADGGGPGWHPEDQEFAEQTIAAAIREKRGYEMDARIVRADGTVRHLHSLAQPVLNAEGEVVELLGVVMDVTDQKRTERALRRARERNLEARFAAMLAERTRLAREIHDTLLQGFTGVALKLLAVTRRTAGQPDVTAELQDIVTLAQKTLEDARHAVWDMRSPTLAEAEFSIALRNAAEDGVRGTGLALEYATHGQALRMDPDVETVALRVVQEAIANTVKHARARTVRVDCRYEPRRVRLSIADDGRGFTVDPDFRTYGGHWGLLGMRERASQIGAKVSVQSNPGRGTEVTLILPYASRAHGQPRDPAPQP